MVEIRGVSVQQVFHDVVLAGPNRGRRVVRIARLRPRDVAAVNAVMEVAKKGDRAWRIINAEPARRLDKAVGLLLALESAVLPALHAYPNLRSIVDALRSYTTKLDIHASATGGEFSTMARDLCTNLGEYVERVDTEEEATELSARVTALIEGVTGLLNAEVTVSQSLAVQ